jgi:hypothetical protein
VYAFRVARGWGRSEEDLGADKEQAREARAPGARPPASEAARRAAARRSLELSLRRVEELLAHTENAERRLALETARTELTERLAAIGTPNA